ncbi:Capsular synthesis regulator component B [Pseudomonas sp. 31 R 17]|jgi:two-component system capsular synthesis response regulator RcsB|uniref:Response regulator transcription factor n=1 Tax=Pseudomonas orientalis TaxID=76758 RepID=A0A4Q7D8S7_9PSED|nr:MULTISPECIES: response regulator transcription factor [Pseudomonas]MDO4233388.1 response regulator transcription factor [Pseudomonas sp.]RZI25071.1 response regulator transcription factor [Pseudomonas orientalis]RZI33009.1 response regulator transcription factor [Pseudomonas orientalis]CRM21006.1 Capsular synthesis regulator component B [Pseudomonas sp. 28 E 9]CRM63289.1 Capsular synthesis regulator component B [Pseudomonas sp. 31 R 17]
MKKINVVIADDHPIVLLGVREVIQRDGRFEVVGEATSSSQLIEKLQSEKPEVVITDFHMPGDSTFGDGLKLIEYLTRRFVDTQILVLTMMSNSLIVTRLHELGVMGVIQKNHLHEEIENALNAIASRRNYQSPVQDATSVLHNPQQVNERFADLSLREMEVLRLFVAGHSVTAIARMVNRSSKTVSAQKVSAMRKLEVTTDQALVTYCVNAGKFQ